MSNDKTKIEYWLKFRNYDGDKVYRLTDRELFYMRLEACFLFPRKYRLHKKFIKTHYATKPETQLTVLKLTLELLET